MATLRRSFWIGCFNALVAVIVLGSGVDPRLGVSEAAAAEPTGQLPLPPGAAGPARDFVPVVKAVTPAVVNISTSRVVRAPGGREQGPGLDDPFLREFFGDEFFRRFQAPRERRENSLGSGVIVSRDGYIVTNNHVIAKADEIRVLLPDGREFTAKLIGADPQTDIAVIRIEAKDDLPTLPWGDSDALNGGEFVLAVGNPFGLTSTVTMGIVSAVGRASVGIADYEDFIQTDAAINPGNSGGALVNVRGELIGINTAIFSQSGGYMGIGFAVPSNMTRTVMDSLIKTGKVTRGWLGVSVQPITSALAEQLGLEQTRGALISDVTPDSPAAAAGIRPGDVILSFDGKPIDSPAVLRNIVAQTPIGKTVKVELLRNNKRQTVTVKIAEQPATMGPAARAAPESEDTGGASVLSGLEVRNLTPEVARQLGLPPETKGVVITGVAPDSAAAAAGIAPGDVILEVNRQPVRSVADLKRISSKLSEKEGALLLVNRRGSNLFLALRPRGR